MTIRKQIAHGELSTIPSLHRRKLSQNRSHRHRHRHRTQVVNTCTTYKYDPTPYNTYLSDYIYMYNPPHIPQPHSQYILFPLRISTDVLPKPILTPGQISRSITKQLRGRYRDIHISQIKPGRLHYNI